jgi:hypothetical protein
MVYPIGFGSGTAGLNGTGFDLLVVFFVELFGVTLGQAIASISPGVGVREVILHVAFCDLRCTGRCVAQPLLCHRVDELLRCDNSVPTAGTMGKVVAILVGPIWSHHGCRGPNRTPVRLFCLCAERINDVRSAFSVV